MQEVFTITQGIIIAGTHSGAGKTTIALGLMAAFKRRGLVVAPFKVGPDFIDPGHHGYITANLSRNLDGWMLSEPYNRANFIHHAHHSDIAVVEGVMGLFDGFSGRSEAGSTAQMAKWLGLPVLLVVNAASMARSAAALVQGFLGFDPEVQFAGVVFNQLGSQGHLAYLKEAMDAYVDLPILGGLVRNDALRMPERHLGLTTVEDQPLGDDQVQLLIDHIESGVDVDGLLSGLPPIQDGPAAEPIPSAGTRDKVRLGVAKDRAFCFYYPDNLELLKKAGMEIIPFSPMNDRHLPDDLDGIYFGGGYPELHAQHLAANETMRNQILHLSNQGMPIYAECGGFMYLCRALEDADGTVYPMCNCFPFQPRMHKKLRTLGYREVRLNSDTLLGSRDQVLRGHEFHYSDLRQKDRAAAVDTVYTAESRSGAQRRAEGYLVNQTLGSYIHLHFGSQPEAPRAFAAACRKHRDAGRSRQ